MTATNNKQRHDTQSSQQQPLLPEPQYVIVLPSYHHHNHRLFRKSWRRGISCCAITFLFLVAAAYLFWPSHPELSVVRLNLDTIRFHTSSQISLDLTLDLTVKVRNRDFYSLDYDSLVVAIGYRGKRLGFVTSGGGHVKARGSSYVNATLQLDGVEVLSDVILLLEDLAKGAITFDTESEMSGRIGLYLFDLPIKTKISCEVIINTRNKTISRQNCYPEVSEVI